MPTESHLASVARQLSQKLREKEEFLTIPRQTITEMIRDVSGEETTRLKRRMGEQLETLLLEQGTRVYPSLQDTSTGDTVRMFRPRTTMAKIVDVVSRPDDSTDKKLKDIIAKLGAGEGKR